MFDEYREGYDGDVEYRYADFPLALGEAIMMNHALFAGLLHANATPITDDQFHSQALSLKLRRSAEDPVVKRVQADRARELKAASRVRCVGRYTTQASRPRPGAPLGGSVGIPAKAQRSAPQARDKLGWMARRIEAEPWSEEFAADLKHRTIPDIAKELDEARNARDAWLKSKRGRLALKAAGVAVGAAAVIVRLRCTPDTRGSRHGRVGPRLRRGHSRCRVAARLARRQEESAGKRIALFVENVNHQGRSAARRNRNWGTSIKL